MRTALQQLRDNLVTSRAKVLKKKPCNSGVQGRNDGRGVRVKAQRRWRRPNLILNEAVHFQKEIIFIAIPKTGTTTVRNQFKQEQKPMIASPHLSIMQIRDTLYAYYLRCALGRNGVFPSQGVFDDKQIRAKARATFKTFFKFAGVRNPWARAVSLYFRREGVQPSQKISFEAFCEQHLYASDTCYHPTLHRNQLDWLCDETGRSLMDYVYKVENLETAVKEIETFTDGRLKLQVKSANVNPLSKSKDYRTFHTDKTRTIIAKRFQKDIDVFKYTF